MIRSAIAPLFILAFCPVQLSAQYNFATVYSGVTANLYDVDFVNPQIGYVCGADGTVLKTVDSGQNWTTVCIAISGLDLYCLDFVNPDTGWVAGNNGQVYYTHDGGLNWNVTMPEATSSTLIFKSMYFMTEELGWIVGLDFAGDIVEVIYITSDGGVTWDPMNFDGVAGEYFDVQFWPASGFGWVVGNNDKILYTSDGGTNWDPATLPGLDYTYETIHMIDENIGLAGGENSQVVYTLDGGESWIEVFPGSPGTTIHDIDVFGTTAVAVGSHGYVTSAGYFSWGTPQFVANLEGIDILDVSKAVIVGHNGLIMRSPAQDVAIVSYVSPDSICGSGEIPVSINIQNNGAETVNSVLISVFEGSAPLFDTLWYGTLPPLASTSVQLGKHIFTNSTTLSIQLPADENGANNQLVKDIYWLNAPWMGVESPVEVCEGTTAQLSATGGTSYYWYGLTGVDAFLPNPVVSPTANTSLIVAITSAVCFGHYEVVLNVNPCTTANETSVFSPNEDGINDYFHIDHLSTDGATKVQIFNRWGEVLFEEQAYDNNNADKRWQGQAKGGKVNPGTYYYSIDKGDKDISTGWVQVVR